MLLETRSTIITNSCRDIVAIHQRPVGTSEERNEVAVGAEVVRRVRAGVDLVTPSSTCLRIDRVGILPVGVGLGIVTYVVVLLITPEVLPLITSHDVEVILGLVVEVVVILSVGRELEIALQDLFFTIITIVHRFGVPGLVASVLFTFRNVGTKRHVEAQVLEPMNLIVNVGTTNERTAVGMFVAAIEQREGVTHGGSGVESERPSLVAGIVGCGWPLEVAAEIAKRLSKGTSQQFLVVYRRKVVRILRRIEIDGCTHSFSVGILRLGIHTLTVKVQGQVIVKERRIQVQGSRDTLEVRGLQDTLLVGIAHAYTVGKILHGTRNRHIVVMADGLTIDFVLPIGIGCTQCVYGDTALTIDTHDESTILVAVHHLKALLAHAQCCASRIGNARLHTLAAFLRSDDDDTVRTTRTVDSRGRSVLQYVERLNVLGIDHRKGVRQTLHTFVIHGKTIDDDQRIVGGVKRRATTDANLCT